MSKDSILPSLLLHNYISYNNISSCVVEFILKAIGTKEEITMKDLEKYINAHSSSITKLIANTHKNVKKSMKEKEYFDEKEYQKHTNYTVIMTVYCILALCTVIIFPLAIVLIINAVYCEKIMKKINVLTQTGLDQKEMWEGLKKYMEEFSLLNEREVPELVLWEKYLVYATAFGIADKVLKQLKVVYPNIDEIDGVNTSTYMYFMYHSNFNTNFSKAISSSIASATYSSGSGSGGGFSGGGGFGGGGRRWRRKIKIFFFKKY